MTPITEEEVRTAAKFQGYQLISFPGGFELRRDHDQEPEIIIASTLELIVDFLKH